MPRVMFTISYAVKPELREAYLALMKEMKEHLKTVGNANYSVYETKGRKNQFAEVFLTDSIEEFDALEDNQDERTQQLVSNIQQYLEDGGMKYTTWVEVL